VNGKALDLSDSTNLRDAYTGQTYGLNGKSAEVEIPETGTIRVVVAGVEQDGQSVHVPNLSDVSRVVNGVPVLGTVADVLNKVAEATGFLIHLDGNDAIGTVVNDYTAINNFGKGWHEVPSSQTGSDRESANDYVIRYSIVEFNPIPEGALSAEVFVDAGFRGSSTVITHNTPFIGGVFHDSITSVKVRAGPNYQPGDKVQICEGADYSGRCITLNGPGDYDIGAPFSFNDRADSIMFIRP